MKVLHLGFLAIALCVALLGCAGGDNGVVTGWGLDEVAPTGIVPTIGHYKFVTDHPINDMGHGHFDFMVLESSSNLQPILYFSADGVRPDLIEIEDGRFNWTHGKLASPTDAYSITGHFVTPDRAEGTIGLASNHKIYAKASFIATFVAP